MAESTFSGQYTGSYEGSYEGSYTGEYSTSYEGSYGGYEVYRSKNKINLTIFASGSEVGLAIEVSHKLATQNIYSKVISVPCQELFDKQSKKYKQKILNETKYKISIEASSTDSWKKYVGESGVSIGINNFGKSGPYKKLFSYFGFDSEKIINEIKKKFKF